MKTNYSTLELDILHYIKSKHDFELDKNNLDSISFNYINMDSLDIAELILYLEEKYKINLDENTLCHVNFIRNFIDMVYDKIITLK